MKWPVIQVSTKHGVETGIAPIIISASRSTDIPAFHTKWFLERLREGYCVWKNPFNQKKQYISFEKTRAVVFWTKNPAPLLEHIHKLEPYGFTFYIQYTLNDYSSECLEPHVPTLNKRIETFRHLSEMIGKERVIWRFDPVLLTNRLSIDELVKRIAYIGDQVCSFTEKLVFSFADISTYTKVRNNLRKVPDNVREPTIIEMRQFAEEMQKLVKSWGIQLATCSEQIDLERYGIEHNRCIDPVLLLRLAKRDRELISFLSQGKGNIDLFGNQQLDFDLLKDAGQRESCGCVVSKDIGQYNTCFHHCTYCYANTSCKVVENNRGLIDQFSESILGELSSKGRSIE